MNENVSTLQLFGAGGFGAIIGWYVYYINRYRKSEVQLNDLAALLGIIGGGAILTLFKTGTDLFGAYGVGLFIGFFGYFVTLIGLVKSSNGNFTPDWFLDGRRKQVAPGYYIPGDVMPTSNAMGAGLPARGPVAGPTSTPSGPVQPIMDPVQP